jgi:hypothetical protein
MQMTEKERFNYILDQLDLRPGPFAEKLKIPVDRVKSIKYGKVKISTEIAILIEQVFGFDFKWTMTGIGNPNSADEISEKPKTSNVYEFQHMKLIREFKNKQLALNITRSLIDLENLDLESFKRIESYLKGTVDAVRDVAEREPKPVSDRRKKQRRLAPNPHMVPKHLDRRSYKDRRKAQRSKGHNATSVGHIRDKADAYNPDRWYG